MHFSNPSLALRDAAAPPPPKHRPYDRRRAALVVHRTCGLAAAVCEKRDGARAAVALLDGILADVRKPTVDLAFDDWRDVLNAVHHALWAIPTHFSITSAAAHEAFVAAEIALRHRHNDKDWEDFDRDYRQAVVKPLERLRNRIKAFAVRRYFASYEGRHAA